MKTLLLAFLTIISADAAVADTNELVVYSVREGKTVAPLFEEFTARTGISVVVINGTNPELMERLKNEGESTPADLFLTKDLVFQGEAARAGVFQPFSSKVVEENIPANFIEPNRLWFTVSYRARVIMYHPDRVNPAELSTYEDLANEKWKGRLCVRTSQNSYNQGMVSNFVKNYGMEKTLRLLEGWVANFSMDPIKADTEVLKTIAAGQCDVGVTNTYYLAALLKNDPSFPVRPFFPNQSTTGTHVNGGGIGIVKHSKNVKEATMLLEYLTEPKVQEQLAAPTNEYPANSRANSTDVLKSFGTFTMDFSNQGEISGYTDQAKELMLQAKYK